MEPQKSPAETLLAELVSKAGDLKGKPLSDKLSEQLTDKDTSVLNDLVAILQPQIQIAESQKQKKTETVYLDRWYTPFTERIATLFGKKTKRAIQQEEMAAQKEKRKTLNLYQNISDAILKKFYGGSRLVFQQCDEIRASEASFIDSLEQQIKILKDQVSKKPPTSEEAKKVNEFLAKYNQLLNIAKKHNSEFPAIRSFFSIKPVVEASGVAIEREVKPDPDKGISQVCSWLSTYASTNCDLFMSLIVDQGDLIDACEKLGIKDSRSLTILPTQRFTKYPLLLDDLAKKVDHSIDTTENGLKPPLKLKQDTTEELGSALETVKAQATKVNQKRLEKQISETDDFFSKPIAKKKATDTDNIIGKILRKNGIIKTVYRDENDLKDARDDIVAAITKKQPEFILATLKKRGFEKINQVITQAHPGLTKEIDPADAKAIKQDFYYSLITDPAISTIIRNAMGDKTLHILTEDDEKSIGWFGIFIEKAITRLSLFRYVSTTQRLIAELNRTNDTKEMERLLLILRLDKAQIKPVILKIIQSGDLVEDFSTIFRQIKEDTIGDILLSNGINIKCSKRFAASVAKIIANAVKTKRPKDIKLILEQYGAEGVTPEKAEAIKQRYYYSKMESQTIRDAMLATAVTIHAQPLDKWHRIREKAIAFIYGYQSTTQYLVNQLDQAYKVKDPKKVNVKAVEKYLFRLGFDSGQIATICQTTGVLPSRRQSFRVAESEEKMPLLPRATSEMSAVAAAPGEFYPELFEKHLPEIEAPRLREATQSVDSPKLSPAPAETFREKIFKSKPEIILTGRIKQLNEAYDKGNVKGMEEALKRLGFSEPQILKILQGSVLVPEEVKDVETVFEKNIASTTLASVLPEIGIEKTCCRKKFINNDGGVAEIIIDKLKEDNPTPKTIEETLKKYGFQNVDSKKVNALLKKQPEIKRKLIEAGLDQFGLPGGTTVTHHASHKA